MSRAPEFITYEKISRADKGILGLSKIGGLPHLPHSLAWPTYTIKDTSYNMKTNVLKEIEVDRALTFVAQINCSDFSSVLHEQHFPKKGMLYFFVEDSWDMVVENPDHFRVLYSNTTDGLSVCKKPKTFKGGEDRKWKGTEKKMLFHEDDPDKNIVGPFFKDQIGGETTWVQDSGLYNAEKLFFQQTIEYTPEAMQKMEAGWTLLLQITDPNSEVTYFHIRNEDLKDLNFERVWCSVQYT